MSEAKRRGGNIRMMTKRVLREQDSDPQVAAAKNLFYANSTIRKALKSFINTEISNGNLTDNQKREILSSATRGNAIEYSVETGNDIIRDKLLQIADERNTTKWASELERIFNLRSRAAEKDLSRC